MSSSPWCVALVAVLVLGCGGPVAPDADAGPKAVLKAWLQTEASRDFGRQWELMPVTARVRFAMAWDKERQDLAQAKPLDQDRFVKVYGFKDFAELQRETPRDFFVRSMGRYPDEGPSAKYERLRQATVESVVYEPDGSSCTLSFRDADGSPLPMTMKMVREGQEWKVVRLP